MDDHAINAVVNELKPLLLGRRFGKVFQLSPESLAIDFGLRAGGYLFISVDPALSRFYLIKRRLRDLEKQSLPTGQFLLSLKKACSQAELISIEKDEEERIVRLKFIGPDELEESLESTLIIQLTGRAANMHVLSEDGVITSQMRLGRGDGQQIGQRYQRPPKPKGGVKEKLETPAVLADSKFTSVSEALDAHYTTLDSKRDFNSQAAAARARLRKQLIHAQKLLTKLEGDRATHADFENHKRLGDLLLANAGSAKRSGNRVTLIDYFDGGTPQIEIELDEKTTLPEEAARHFAHYSRSKRALEQIAGRIQLVKAELGDLEDQQERLEQIIATGDEAALLALSETATSSHSDVAGQRKSVRERRIPGVRQYLSADGFEILVGRAAHDNDNLTFKIARPNDLWLHAADYPGSHVIVRNSTRKDLPHPTLVEAAQLAAYFSQANKNARVDVHYTPRKFVSKIRGAAPGLVRISRQKNIAVEPKEAATRINL